MKAPAFQFYVKDWLSDPQLKMASFAVKGMWIDILCFMWTAPERGKLTGSRPQLAKLIGAKPEEIDRLIQESVDLQFCCYEECNGVVTLINRRMNNEWKEKESTRLRVGRFRAKEPCNGECNADGNGNVTPLSATASASATTNKKNIYLDCVSLTDEELQKLVAKYGRQNTDKAISILNNYLMSKGKDPYKSHYFTLIGWPIEKAMGGDNGRARNSGTGPGIPIPIEHKPQTPLSEAEIDANLRRVRELISFGSGSGDVPPGMQGGE